MWVAHYLHVCVTGGFRGNRGLKVVQIGGVGKKHVREWCPRVLSLGCDVGLLWVCRFGCI
jgi:hypothetical protein